MNRSRVFELLWVVVPVVVIFAVALLFGKVTLLVFIAFYFGIVASILICLLIALYGFFDS